MASFNKICIVGFLGRDVELRYTSDGTPVSSFSIATTQKKKDQEITTWFKATCWNRLAEVANEYLAKGSQVYIEGRLSQNEYQDKDGNTKTSLEVNVSDLQFLSSRNSDSKPVASPAVSDDEIPF